MSRVNVAVLRGGPSSEYDVSLATGATLLANLNEEKYNTKDVLIGRDGAWHSRGVARDPGRVLQDIDVALIALHGEYGEDGSVQKVLEQYSVPYAGSGVFPSSIAIDKGKTRMQTRTLSEVRTPKFSVLTTSALEESLTSHVQSIFTQFGPPYIVKPLRGGSSVDIYIAKNILELSDILDDMLSRGTSVIVEQFISGREATCGVIDNFREQDVYTLPPIEIVLPSGTYVFDYDAKYRSDTEKLCPSNFTNAEKEAIQRAALAVHKNLGLRHYSRSDFRITPSGAVYFLEVNTLPGLTEHSLLPASLEAVGVGLPEFLDHLVIEARR